MRSITLVIFWFLCLTKAHAATNITIDDSSRAILYQPSNFWSANSEDCDLCLHPNVNSVQGIFNGTWHFGRHNISFDADDLTTSASASSTTAAPPSTSNSPVTSTPTPSTSNSPVTPAPISTPSPTGGEDDDDDDEDDDDDDEGGEGEDRDDVATRAREGGVIGDDDDSEGRGRDRDDSGSNRSGSNGGRRGKQKRQDSDDSGFVDSVVTAQFKFRGTAVYLYSLLPLFAPAPNPSGLPATPILSPTTVNLSFTLDNTPSGSFFHDSTSTNSDGSFESDALVFAQEGLSDVNHVLLVTVAPDTIWMFDYMVYTSNDVTLASLTPTSTSTGSSPSDTNAASSSNSKHNVATFAGAIAGSAGALSILALGTWLSLVRRRRIAAKRERLSSLNTNSPEPRFIGPGIGPRPFIPRYFPGTVVPPPSYDESNSPTQPYYMHGGVGEDYPEDLESGSATDRNPSRSASGRNSRSSGTSRHSRSSEQASTAPLLPQTVPVPTSTGGQVQMAQTPVMVQGPPILRIPRVPPPVYVPSPTEASRSTPPGLTPRNSRETMRRVVEVTYADIPPSVPPPPADQLQVPLEVLVPGAEAVRDAPPSFGEAITTPPFSAPNSDLGHGRDIDDDTRDELGHSDPEDQAREGVASPESVVSPHSSQAFSSIQASMMEPRASHATSLEEGSGVGVTGEARHISQGQDDENRHLDDRHEQEPRPITTQPTLIQNQSSSVPVLHTDSHAATSGSRLSS